MIPSYFPMDSIKRFLVCLEFLVSCVAFAILCSAMFTQEWTVVKPVRTGLNVTFRLSSHSDINRFQGLIYFGLFKGKKILNYGFGNREFDLRIVCVAKMKVCMYSTKENSTARVKDLQDNLLVTNSAEGNEEEVFNESLLSFGLWAATVSCVCLAAMFAIIGAAFSIVSIIKTSEAISGFIGLYLWNVLGGMCSIATVFTWSTQYFLKFRKNVMTQEEREQHWTSEYRSCMGFSFYLVVLSIVFFIVNIGVLTLIIKQPWVDRKLKADLRKKLSNPSFIPKSPAPSITKKRQFK